MTHIIIADDDPGIQDVLKVILNDAGYRVTVCTTGDPLLNNDFEEPDAFLVDRQLADVDGLDVCRYLKSRANINTPIIIFSASNRIRELALNAGADDFLEKPFKIKTLLDMLTRVTVKDAQHTE